MSQPKTGVLQFTVDFPALYSELISPGNLHNIGPGGAMGLRVVLLGLKEIAKISIDMPESTKGREGILQALSNLGIVDLDAGGP